jgi:hypothetical protein
VVDFGSFKQGSNELNTQKYHMTSLFCMNEGMLRFVPTYKLWSQILSEVEVPPEVQTLGLYRTSRPVRKSGNFSKSGLSGNGTFSFPDAGFKNRIK